jgi:hypothetical protein
VAQRAHAERGVPAIDSREGLPPMVVVRAGYVALVALCLLLLLRRPPRRPGRHARRHPGRWGNLLIAAALLAGAVLVAILG